MIDALYTDPRLGRLDKSGQDLVLSFAELEKQSAVRRHTSAVQELRKSVEWLQKANPTLGNVHISQELATVLIGFFQRRERFVAASDSRMPVNFKAGSYHKMDLGDLMRHEGLESVRAPGVEAPKGGFRQTTASYSCERRAWRQDIYDEVAANQAVGDPEVQAMLYVGQILEIIRENMWVSALFGTGLWTGDQTGVAAAPAANQFLQWNDAASLPRTDISAQAVVIWERTGFAPNRFYCDPHVLRNLLLNPQIVDAFKHTTPGATPNRAGLMAALFVDGAAGEFTPPELRVIGGVHNTAAEGATATMAFIAPKAALLAYVNPTPALYSPTAYLQFQWTAAELGGAGNSGIIAKRFTDPQRAITAAVEGEFFLDFHIVEPALGVFFTAAVA